MCKYLYIKKISCVLENKTKPRKRVKNSKIPRKRVENSKIGVLVLLNTFDL